MIDGSVHLIALFNVDDPDRYRCFEKGFFGVDRRCHSDPPNCQQHWTDKDRHP